MSAETRERLVVRILLFVARLIARPLPDDVRAELKTLENHVLYTREPASHD